MYSINSGFQCVRLAHRRPQHPKSEYIHLANPTSLNETCIKKRVDCGLRMERLLPDCPILDFSGSAELRGKLHRRSSRVVFVFKPSNVQKPSGERKGSRGEKAPQGLALSRRLAVAPGEPDGSRAGAVQLAGTPGSARRVAYWLTHPAPGG